MRYFVVHAFTNRLFSGNPAGVCVVNHRLEPQVMQRIAHENSLPETAFILEEDGGFRIRWFTPAFEMDLCGHATLSAGFVVLNLLRPEADSVVFSSPSGPLTVARRDGRYTLDFPARPPVSVPIPEGLEAVLGAKVLGCSLSRDLIIELESADTVQGLTPDFERLGLIEGCMGFVPTAAGDGGADFVSRFFDPHDAIIEDPVTGSSHCSLIPFWAERLGKDTLVARQLSRRGGTLYCRNLGERVEIAGDAVLYLEGKIHLGDD